MPLTVSFTVEDEGEIEEKERGEYNVEVAVRPITDYTVRKGKNYVNLTRVFTSYKGTRVLLKGELEGDTVLVFSDVEVEVKRKR